MNEKLLGSDHLNSRALALRVQRSLDAFNVALVVGGSITIPHLRRAIDRVDQFLETKDDSDAVPHSHNE